jgi:hypothetical protein
MEWAIFASRSDECAQAGTLNPTDLISYMFIVVKVILQYILRPLQ